MEHDAQPHQGDQHQLVEKERRDHSKTPHTSAEMRVFYPVCRWWELAAGWRDTTEGFDTIDLQEANALLEALT
jgi:hypothetical protein